MIDDGEEDITKGNDEWWWQKMYKDLKILTKNHYHLVLFWLSLPQFYSKTQTKITKKMETKVEFRLLVLNSLRSETPIDRSAKTIISKNFTISWHNQLFLWHKLVSNFSTSPREFKSSISLKNVTKIRSFFFSLFTSYFHKNIRIVGNKSNWIWLDRNTNNLAEQIIESTVK